MAKLTETREFKKLVARGSERGYLTQTEVNRMLPEGAREGNQDGAVGLPLIVFEGSAALNAWLYRFTFLAVLQAQLERAGG